MKPLTLTHPDGTVEVLYEPTPKQAEWHALSEPNALFIGSRGTGKSLALRWEAHIRAMATPNFNYAIMRRTGPELEKSHLMFIAAEMKKLGGYFHHTKNIAYYPNGSTGFYTQCSDEEHVLTLLSAQYGMMGFDEISTFPWEMVTKLAGSLRVVKNSGLMAVLRACTNPLGVSADEINHYFVLRDVDTEEDPEYNPNDWASVKVHLEDNPHIDQVQYRKRFSGMSAHVRRAWLDGEFCLENALFEFLPRKNGEPYHVIDQLPLFNGRSIIESYN